MVWDIFWRRNCTGVRPSPFQLAASGWHILLSGVVLQDESGRCGYPWAALTVSQRPLVAACSHRSHTSLPPRVIGLDFRASLSSTEPLVCARHSSNCFYAPSHFILTLPYHYLHLADEKVQTQGFKPRQCDPTTTLNSAFKTLAADAYKASSSGESLLSLIHI